MILGIIFFHEIIDLFKILDDVACQLFVSVVATESLYHVVILY
uniref:Uncharacterized protein n=1 Tax=Arundo donax TaxID=35708 RepID=A0A0A8ZBJ1_ARUDO